MPSTSHLAQRRRKSVSGAIRSTTPMRTIPFGTTKTLARAPGDTAMVSWPRRARGAVARIPRRQRREMQDIPGNMALISPGVSPDGSGKRWRPKNHHRTVAKRGGPNSFHGKRHARWKSALCCGLSGVAEKHLQRFAAGGDQCHYARGFRRHHYCVRHSSRN
jgi:hypothetical protein